MLRIVVFWDQILAILVLYDLIDFGRFLALNRVLTEW